MAGTSAHFLAEGVRAERVGALDRALELYRLAGDASDDAASHAEALTHEADVLRLRCEWDEALSAATRAQTIAREGRAHHQLAEAIIAEANVWLCRGEFAAAMPKFCEIVSTSHDPRLKGIALQNIGAMNAQTGQTRAAAVAFEESRDNFRQAGYVRGEAIALNNLGRLALDSGDASIARGHLERAIVLARDVDDHELAALASMNLALVLCNTDDFERAQDLATMALGYFVEAKNRWREIECLRLVGQINQCCEDFQNAKRCYDLALSLAEQIGSDAEVQLTRERLDALSRLEPRPYF